MENSKLPTNAIIDSPKSSHKTENSNYRLASGTSSIDRYAQQREKNANALSFGNPANVKGKFDSGKKMKIKETKRANEISDDLSLSDSESEDMNNNIKWEYFQKN